MWMLLNALGRVPDSDGPSRLAIKGGIIADSMGLRKTVTKLLYLAHFLGLHTVRTSDVKLDNRNRHKPSAIRAPKSDVEEERGDTPLSWSESDRDGSASITSGWSEPNS